MLKKCIFISLFLGLFLKVGKSQGEVFINACLEGKSKHLNTGVLDSCRILFLENIYKHINYPLFARNHDVTGVFKVEYTILKSGLFRLDSISVCAKSSLLKAFNNENSILIRDYIVPFFDISYGIQVPREKRNIKPFYLRVANNLLGKQLIKREIERVLYLLPTFIPASHNGKPTDQAYTEFFIFDLE